MLSNEQAASLIRYYQTVQLTGEQKDRLVAKYWEANDSERREIARAYAKVFAEDGAFMQRLVAFFDLRKSQHINGNGGGAGASEPSSPKEPISSIRSGGGGGSSEFCSPLPQQDGGSGASAGSPTSPGGYVSSRLTHSQRLLRTAIQDKFPKLTGPGPFQIRFGLVRSESERKEMIDLYASQFTAPDPPELQKLVTLPQTHSTRTRRKISGNYSFYVRCLNTQEMVCAVTITAHHHQTHHFVEMPLFATAGGYKKNGFGRLLNAALAAWCVSADFEFIMISADINAIPFWKRMGYEMMTASEKKKIAFYYEHECYKFSGAEPMIGYCGRSRRFRGGNVASQQQLQLQPSATEAAAAAAMSCDSTGSPSAVSPPTKGVVPLSEQSVGRVLQQMPTFAVVGPLKLSTED